MIEFQSNLVHVITSDDLVEAGVKIVQQGDHLERRALEAQFSEADDVAEIDRCIFVCFRLDLLSTLELICNRPV